MGDGEFPAAGESRQVAARSKKGDGSIFQENRTVPFSWFLEFHHQGQLVAGFKHDLLALSIGAKSQSNLKRPGTAGPGRVKFVKC